MFKGPYKNLLLGLTGDLIAAPHGLLIKVALEQEVGVA